MTRTENRINIKLKARETLQRNKFTLIISNLLVGAIIFVPSFIQGLIINSYTSMFILTFLQLIIATPLSIGMIMMNMLCIRGEEIKLKDIFRGFDRLYQVYGVTLLRGIIIALLTTPLLLIPITMSDDQYLVSFVVSIITSISNVIFAVIFAQVDYIVADKKNVSIIEAIKQSINLMKGHFVEYIIFNLSFLGWILLMGATLGLAAIWVLPYMNLCYVYYYDYVKENKSQEYKTTNNKGIVIGIIVGIMLVVYSVVENYFNSWAFSPQIIKQFLNDNNLMLVSINTEENYYLSKEERNRYKIDIGEYLDWRSEKYSLVVRNHTLDSKEDDNIKNTIIYIIVNRNKIVGVSCEPLKSKFEMIRWSEVTGSYDFKGNLIK